MSLREKEMEIPLYSRIFLGQLLLKATPCIIFRYFRQMNEGYQAFLQPFLLKPRQYRQLLQISDYSTLIVNFYQLI